MKVIKRVIIVLFILSIPALIREYELRILCKLFSIISLAMAGFLLVRDEFCEEYKDTGHISATVFICVAIILWSYPYIAMPIKYYIIEVYYDCYGTLYNYIKYRM